MKLRRLYEEVVKKGIEADPRGREEVERILKENREVYNKLSEKEKELFDVERFFNPFSDTRVLNGDLDEEIVSMMVGIDIGGEELLLVDRLRERGVDIGIVVSHHPQGRAYAGFYDVMDLQVDIFTQQGVNLSLAENLLQERKAQVERRVGAINHQRVVDIARWLKINFMCVHTPADNLAYRYIEETLRHQKPKKLGDIIDILLTFPEYREAAKGNNPPKIIIGNKKSRVSKVHIEFTGGTEGPQDIYQRLSNSGVDTIISMHQSEEHFKKCKEANINVVVASHIASDTLGVNLMLDHLSSLEKFKIYEVSGFRRFSHINDDGKK